MLPRKIADSTVRRLAMYLRFLEEFDTQGQDTVSSDALARRAGTTSAQVRKDLSFFGSFGKRGLGYDVPALAERLREILGLVRRYRVILIGAGKCAMPSGRKNFIRCAVMLCYQPISKIRGRLSVFNPWAVKASMKFRWGRFMPGSLSRAIFALAWSARP